MRRCAAVLGAVVALVGPGCASSKHAARQLHRQASVDLNCAARHVQVLPLGSRGGAEYVAQGCGRRATYAEGPDGPQLVGAVQPLPSASQPPPLAQARRQQVPQAQPPPAQQPQQQSQPLPPPLPLPPPGDGVAPQDGELSAPPLPVPER